MQRLDTRAPQSPLDEEKQVSAGKERLTAPGKAGLAHPPSSWHPLPEVFQTLAAENPRAVLLEAAKNSTSDYTSLLFLTPVKELTAWTAKDLDELLSQVDRHSSQGRFVAGYFHYECGEHFVGLPPIEKADERRTQPLAWLGVYVEAIEFNHLTGAIQGNLPPPQSALGITAPLQSPSPSPVIISEGLQIGEQDYSERLARIREYLDAGHTYQVNFTDRICGSTGSEPLEVYRSLLRQQPVPFAAYLNAPSGTILSFSPEMFYRVSGDNISARPMKGTWPRGVNNSGDEVAAAHLQSDEKNRSEHIMIVDLLRNDLGRLCEFGTVLVDDLFTVERYSTLLQMTSSIAGTLRDHWKPSEIFHTLFPSGSITGAPKRRTMEIIRELERGPRGIYTGAIGYFGPRSEACFSVAIRTLTLEDKRWTLGVGGGITADSTAEQEYEECRLKGSFLTHPRPPFSLIETMRCDGGIPLLESHMLRLAESARYFDIRYDASALMAEIISVANNAHNTLSRIRMELHEDGCWRVSQSPLETTPWSGRILLVPDPIDSKNIFFHHKTTNRNFYEHHLAAARQEGFDEILCMNESSKLTEGAISNFFFQIDGEWLTPPLACGVLPGVRRTFLLQSLDGARECELELEDILKAERILACNALRNERPVYSIQRKGLSAGVHIEIWWTRVESNHQPVD
jgi:para-aminobenzoate synthetase / 4-amino-4-deoxychorismate lyase